MSLKLSDVFFPAQLLGQGDPKLTAAERDRQQKRDQRKSPQQREIVAIR